MSDYDDDDAYYLYGSEEDELLESPDTADGDFDLTVSTEKGKSKDIEHEPLDPEHLSRRMEEEIQKVVYGSGLDNSIASILCRHYRWNTERLLEKYIETPNAVLQSIGECPSKTSSGPPSKKPRTRSSTDFICRVCFIPPGEESVFKPRCGHKFCRECWSYYIRNKIKDEGLNIIQCMEEQCSTVLTCDDVKSISDPDTYQRYRELLSQCFVKASSHLKFCPFPSCDQAVSSNDVTASSLTSVVPIVSCARNHSFCFGCDAVNEDHRPAICKVVSMWLTSAREDSGTSEWLKANTRNCPKCSQQIEKNGGCNRIMCRHCNHQFCWVCKASWDTHGYKNKSCNAFAEPEKTDPETAAKSNLERWLFYFDRWNNHELSAMLDERLFQRAEERIAEVQSASHLSWIEAQFMKNAAKELTRCRVTLKWSYSMAFYLKPGNSKQIFEDIQDDLEKAVEDLSQMLEEEIKEDTVHSLRQRMMDRTVYVRGRHQIVLDDTAKGLIEGRWEWNVPME